MAWIQNNRGILVAIVGMAILYLLTQKKRSGASSRKAQVESSRTRDIMDQKGSLQATLRRFARDAIIMVSALTVGVVALFAVFLWFLQFLGDPEQTASYASGSPFTLAQVMAVFGAFGIAGGFSAYGSADLRSSLRQVGVLYILSALGFSLLGMMLPILPSADEGTSSHTYLEWATLGAFTVAAATFYWGTLVLLFSIGTLLTGDAEDANPS